MAFAAIRRTIRARAVSGLEFDRTSMAERIQRRVTAEHICVLTFDRPGSTANFFDRATLEELRFELDFVTGEASLRGLVLASAKPSIFIAGADLSFFVGQRARQQLRAYIEMGQTQINRLAALPIPTVAAIHGACLGGGYEVCLACRWRIASATPATKIGLPETTLGLLPAWGGTTRLPRLIGLEAALDLILTGKALAAEQALRAGVVDEVVVTDNLVETACQRILSPGATLPRRTPKPAPPAEVIQQIVRSRREAVLRKTRGHNPAVLKALEIASAGVGDSMRVSLTRERVAFVELVQSEPTQNLLRLFFLQERARKTDKTVAPLPPIKQIAVIGAGTMGAGITYWASLRGLSVALCDVDAEAAAHGLARVAHLYDEGVKRGHFTPEQVRAGLGRITADNSDAALASADLIIEAAVEVLEVKRSIFRYLDEVAPANAILATNTSALSISEIAGAAHRPERVVGLHFFNPVDRMQLVEVIAGRHTAPAAIQRARRFAQQLSKLPVLVKDSPGFVVNRILMPYLLEAVRLLAAGACRDEIDETMLEFGMAMGPLRVIDEVGIDIALHIAETLERHFGDRARPPESLRLLREAGQLGRKSGAGFYSYGTIAASTPSFAQSQDSPAPAATSNSAAALPREALQQRMLLLMVNEAARCVEEAVVSEPADVDFAMMMGAGFGSFRGGPLRYADSAGIARMVAVMEDLTAQEGGRFTPCALLRTHGVERRNFYT